MYNIPAMESQKRIQADSPELAQRISRDWWKRPFDLAVLCAVHIALAPVWLILWTAIPLAIRISDRGPVFYIQERVGRNGKVFKLYKFRSMVVDAENATGAIWARPNDHRITPVGRFLRAHALDELPQVINMWKGDISLVGPRAERPEIVERIERERPEFRARLAVRPGLTGIAQVCGQYSSLPRHKLRYDNLYIKRMSPWLDIKILFLSTLVAVRGNKWR